MATAMALAGVVAAMTASVALAQSSSVKGYGGNGGTTQSTLAAGNSGNAETGGQPAGGQPVSSQPASGQPTAAAETAGSGALPFTGLDVGLAIGGGLLLLGAGAAITAMTPRRKSAPNEDS